MSRQSGLDLARVATAVSFGFFASAQFLVGTQAADGTPFTHFMGEGIRVASAASFVLAGAALGLRYGTAPINYGEYLPRRLLSVVPAFVLLLLFRACAVRSSFVFHDFLDALLSLGYFYKSFANRPDVFAEAGWFLGPLLQLYLVFPFIHRFTQTRGWRWAAGLLVIAVLGRFVASSLGANEANINGWTTLGRLDQFVLGYLAAQCVVQQRAIAVIAGVGGVVGGLGLAARSYWAQSPNRIIEFRDLAPLFLGLVLASLLLVVLRLTERRRLPRLGWLLPALFASQLFLLPVLDALQHRGLVAFTPSRSLNLALNAALIALPLALLVGSLMHSAFLAPLRAALERRTGPKETAVASGSFLSNASSSERLVGNAFRSKNIGYLSGLDHLRGLAALLVIAYHSYESTVGALRPGECQGILWTVLLEGHTGVGLFMVLSGFVFMHGAQGRSIAYWSFIRNRVLRVYPLFILLLIIAAATYRGSITGFGIIQALVTLGNLPGAGYPINDVTPIAWALSPEFQFYLLFPILLQKLDGKNNVKWTITVFAALLAVRLLVYNMGNDVYDTIYWTVFGRLIQFMIGMWAARIYRRWGGHAALFPIAVAIIVGLMVVARRQGTALAPGRFLWGTTVDIWLALGWAFLLVNYLPFAERLPELLSRPLRLLGACSYSMYLMHWSVLISLSRHHVTPAIVNDINVNALAIFALIHLPVVLLVSTLTYNIIEKPFLELRARYLVDRPDASTGTAQQA